MDREFFKRLQEFEPSTWSISKFSSDDDDDDLDGIEDLPMDVDQEASGSDGAYGGGPSTSGVSLVESSKSAKFGHCQFVNGMQFLKIVCIA